MRALVKALGLVDAERFVAVMLREPFDYTKWQRQLWSGKSIKELSAEAMEYRKSLERKKAKTASVRPDKARRAKASTAAAGAK